MVVGTLAAASIHIGIRALTFGRIVRASIRSPTKASGLYYSKYIAPTGADKAYLAARSCWIKTLWQLLAALCGT